MIKNYTFRNFQSYLNETTVDFEVKKRASDSFFDYTLNDGSKVSKIMCVFGANGSGKSNLLKPITFVSWFMTNSFKSLDSDSMIPIISHFSAKDEPSFLEVDFVIPKRCDDSPSGSYEFEYRYSLELNHRRVLREEVKFKNEKTNQYNRLISRIYNEETDSYEYKKSSYHLTVKKDIIEKCPRNASIIAYLARMSEDKVINENDQMSNISLINSYFRLTEANLAVIGRTSFRNSEDITKILVKNEDLFKKVKSLLIGYDVGIKDIIFQDKEVYDEETGELINKKIPLFAHEHDGETHYLPLWMQSSGTQSAYVMISILALQLVTGGIAVLDEFDNDLHPHLTLEILELFKYESENIGNAQLFFTTHTPQVLEVLNKQHVYLVEKENSVSDAWRVDEVEGIKERDNLYAKYVSGVLGAVPNFE
ncbi:ATP-binding protein [Vibrio parahaemolyticus]|nr:ATP-binding protein [Vibrio parahaemolyticus]MDG2700686.1 ATP-binding protein [Vibrio parahaemolyticus]HCG6969614.1 AAA family ATPase [Vibrio parahaemolyticus]